MKKKDITSRLIDEIYGKIYALNDRLMRRSEKIKKNDEIYSCADIFDFYISSQAISFLKLLYTNDVHNNALYLSTRCILEGIALKNLCKQSVVGTYKEKLLQKQVFLIEYKQYKKFNDIADQILLPDKFQYDWEQTYDYYRTLLKDKFSQKRITCIIKSEIPFLCEPNTNYRKIIAENLGEEMASLYGVCSFFTHPSTNNVYRENAYTIVLPILELLLKEYANLPYSDYSLSADLANTNNPFANTFLELFKNVANVNFSIADSFQKEYGHNYVSDTFATIGYSLFDIALDKQLGLAEQIKCKWKMLLELYSVFSYIYFKTTPKHDIYELIKQHRTIQLKRNLNEPYSTDEAYKLFCSIYATSCEKSDFDKGFKTVLGYLINKNGRAPSLSFIVQDFINQFDKDDNGQISLGKGMLLEYCESQMLSHANGYMWFSNSGAFNDVNHIVCGIIMSSIHIIEKMLSTFKIYSEVENKTQYKSIINILRNSLKRLKELYFQITNMLAIPMMQKWHVG